MKTLLTLFSLLLLASSFHDAKAASNIESSVVVERLKKAAEDKRREIKDIQIQESMKEVRSLTGEITGLIYARRQEALMTEQERKDKLQREAQDFGKSMGQMLKIKEELRMELEQAKEAAKKKEDELAQQKGQEEVDEITRMIREAAKKDKE